MVKLVDTADLKSAAPQPGVPVRFRFEAPCRWNFSLFAGTVSCHDTIQRPLRDPRARRCAAARGCRLRARFRRRFARCGSTQAPVRWQPRLRAPTKTSLASASMRRPASCRSAGRSRVDEEFRQVIEEACMALNDIAAAGAPLEVSFYDTEFDEEDESAEGEARDDFMMCFVGPTPAAIMQVQRDLAGAGRGAGHGAPLRRLGARRGGRSHRQAVQPALRCAGQLDAAGQAAAGPWWSVRSRRAAQAPSPALSGVWPC
jgi:hypothetical protein